MKFISLTYWTDLEDGHMYSEGDEFPFDGRRVPKARLNELQSSENKAGFPLIKADKE